MVGGGQGAAVGARFADGEKILGVFGRITCDGMMNGSAELPPMGNLLSLFTKSIYSTLETDFCVIPLFLRKQI
jgi:hypothetical protein